VLLLLLEVVADARQQLLVDLQLTREQQQFRQRDGGRRTERAGAAPSTARGAPWAAACGLGYGA